jgi:hypothetical protein
MRFISSPLHQEEAQHTDERDQRDLPCTGVSRDKPRRIARFALTAAMAIASKLGVRWRVVARRRDGVFFDIGNLSARR